ncbi:MAG TPA: serine hydrolase [Burkholderiaceae bacterium]
MKRFALSMYAASIAVLLFANIALAAPDEELLGKAQGYPIGTPKTWFYDESVRVGSFSNVDKILPFHTLEKSDMPAGLKRVAATPDIRYTFQGQSYSVDDFLQHQRITGLLIIKDGEIQLERYQYDRKPTDRFVSHSMAKSITSLAVGFALEEGKINSLDDKVSKYVPELAGCAYGETSLRNLLRMSSGIKFVEDYSGHDDLTKFIKIWFTDSLAKAICAFNERDTKEGDQFHYATSQTYILGLVIKHATGFSLSEYVDAKIWKPMGAEADAKWTIDLQGNEMAGGNFNAILRDYGRLGMLLANDGMLNGKQILPKNYLLEATDWRKQPDAFAPGHATSSFGYGYQFWILPSDTRKFALLGVYGQTIYVDPESRLVMVQTAVAKNASVRKESLGAESYALWNGVERHYQNATDVNLPPEIKQVFDQMSAAWVKKDLDGVMAQYHPQYMSSTAKNLDKLRAIYSEKFLPYTKRFEWKISSLRIEGDLAYINGSIDTDVGTFPLPNDMQLIKDGNRWYIYGNQKAPKD